MKRPSLGVFAAGVFAVIAVASWLAWWLTDWADEWTVNIATELAAVALTLAVVERIIRRESALRLRPITTRALDRMQDAVAWVAAYIAVDYAETHLDNPKEIPDGVIAIVDLWIEGEDLTDADRTMAAYNEPVPHPVAVAHSHRRDLDQVLRDYGEYLEPRLIVGLDSFVHSIDNAWGAAVTSHDDPGGQQASVSWIAHAARDFARVFEDETGTRLTVDAEFRSMINGMRALALERRQEKAH